MEYFTKIWEQLSNSSFSIIGLLLLVCSLLNCFLGYRLKKLWIAILGFLIGVMVGLGVAFLFTGTTWILLLSALAGGILLAFLAFKIYLVGVFVYVAAMVYVMMVELISKGEWWTLAICVIVALLAGILAVNFVRPAIIITTSISGGFIAVSRVLGWLSVSNIYLLYGLAAVLAILGMIVQFRGSRE